MKSEETYQAGYFRDRTAFVRFGTGERHLVVLEDLRTDHLLPYGLALQGIKDAWQDLSPHLRITLLSRPRNLAEGTTQEDFARDLLDYLESEAGEPVELLAQGISVPTALEAARISPESFSRLWLVSGAPRLSDEGQELFQNLLEDGRHHRWARVHRRLARTMFKKPLGKALGGLVAALFSSDLGRPENPWDFLVTLQAVLAWNPSPEEVPVPMNIWTGLADPLYSLEDWDAWLDINPDAVLEALDHPHGLLKIRGEEIRQGILTGI